METIHTRVMCLTGWLLDQLTALCHSNGTPLIRIYGPLDTCRRGGTVAVNFYDPQGRLIDFRWVETRANQRNISIRTGCFCNPGAGEVANGLTEQDMKACFQNEERMSFEQFLTVMDGKASGAVRVSVGLASTFADVYQFVQFARTFVDMAA
jgi:molybdenum cofactor sulfurtransferase